METPLNQSTHFPQSFPTTSPAQLKRKTSNSKAYIIYLINAAKIEYNFHWMTVCQQPRAWKPKCKKNGNQLERDSKCKKPTKLRIISIAFGFIALPHRFSFQFNNNYNWYLYLFWLPPNYFQCSFDRNGILTMLCLFLSWNINTQVKYAFVLL